MDVFDKMASDFRKEAKIPKGSLKITKGDKKTFKKHQKNMMKNFPKGYKRWLAYQGAWDGKKIDYERVERNLQNKLQGKDRKEVERFLAKKNPVKRNEINAVKYKSKKKASEEEFYYNLMLRMASEDEDFIDDLEGFDRYASDMLAHGLFDEYDEDGDDMISRDEWGGSDSVFDAIDLDDDDMLSRDEVSTGIGEEFAEFNRYASEDDYEEYFIDDLEGFDRFASDYDFDDDFEYRVAGRGKEKLDRPARKKRYKKTRKLLDKKYKTKPWRIVWKAYEGAYTPSGLNAKRLRENLKGLGLSLSEFKKLTKTVGRKGKKMKSQDKKDTMKQIKKTKK